MDPHGLARNTTESRNATGRIFLNLFAILQAQLKIH
jgi:hypothetical protein